LLSSGQVDTIEAINVELLDQPITVYNFEVEDWHTYFVSVNNVLVHNMCAAGGRTLEGYIKNNVPINKEIAMYTKSAGFNNVGTIGGQFKRIGSDSHAGLSPHVHQPQRNVDPNGNIRGSVGTKTRNGGVTLPTRRDVKQLYNYLNNGNYRP